MGNILQHIVKWVIPKWRMPANASEQYQSLVWSDFFAGKIIRADDEATRRNRAVRLLKGIWNEIDSDHVWQDKGSVESQVDTPIQNDPWANC